MPASVQSPRAAAALRRYVIVVSLASLSAVALFALLDGDDFASRIDVSLICLAALAVLGEFVRIRVFRRDIDGELTLSTAFSFAVLLDSGPLAACVVLAIASVAADVHARKPVARVWFNAAQYVLSMAGASIILAVLSGVPIGTVEPFVAAELPSMALAALFFFTLNGVLVATVIALSRGYEVVSFVRSDVAFVAASTGLAIGLAPIAVLAARFSPLLVPALMLPLYGVHRAARQAVELEHRTLHDALTGLPNRDLLRQRVERAIANGVAGGEQIAVLLIDLDHFKEINDTLGHLHGDLLLREIAQRLAAAARPGDTVARLGGDEFAVVLANVGNPVQAIGLAQSLRRNIAEPIDVEGVVMRTEASIGMAIAPDHGRDVDTLLRRADISMYVAKGGRTGVEAYDSSQESHSPARLALAGELRRALEQRELVVYYQPQAAVSTGLVTGVEALVRWHHPRRGLVGPDLFVPLAENTGLIGPLTVAVLDNALAQVRAWDRMGVHLDLAVNLSTRSLLDRGLPGVVSKMLARHGLAPQRLELEITESMIASDPDRALEVLAQLRSVGVRLALDDFGTGYSSLANLRDLAVERLKIDRSFTQAMSESHPDAVIVASTVDLAHQLGLEVVAEGVESQDAWERLRQMGCDLAQGYFLARPMAPEHATAWLTGRRRLETGAPPALVEIQA
jgi:diguanylate cyclase (GGDEF)-like protein